MSTWVIMQRRVGGLSRGHLDEARRALIAQNRDQACGEQLARALWAARALPVALDVLASPRTAPQPSRLVIAGVRVVRAPDGGSPVEGDLIAVGVHEAGSHHLEVRFVPPAFWDESDSTQAMSAAVIAFTIGRDLSRDPADAHDIVVSRFNFNDDDRPLASKHALGADQPSHADQPGRGNA